MNEKELKEYLDQVYDVGRRNGAIEMKNKILKSLNRDWKLFSNQKEVEILVKTLKKINKLCLPTN